MLQVGYRNQIINTSINPTSQMQPNDMGRGIVCGYMI